MTSRLLVVSLAVICFGAADVALAQGAEPSSRVKPGADENVFVNGVSTVQGAPTDVDTAPSKFSERTAADDRLPIVGYRLKHYSADQRREIARQLSVPSGYALSPADLKGYATLGMELPGTIAMQALTPVPQTIAEKYPELRGTGFMPSDGKMLIVDLDNNLVVGVLES